MWEGLVNTVLIEDDWHLRSFDCEILMEAHMAGDWEDVSNTGEIMAGFDMSWLFEGNSLWWTLSLKSPGSRAQS